MGRRGGLPPQACQVKVSFDSGAFDRGYKLFFHRPGADHGEMDVRPSLQNEFRRL